MDPEEVRLGAAGLPLAGRLGCGLLKMVTGSLSEWRVCNLSRQSEKGVFCVHLGFSDID